MRSFIKFIHSPEHDGPHNHACVYGVYGGREVSWLIAGFASRPTAMVPQIPLAQWTPIAPIGSSMWSSSYWYHWSLLYSQYIRNSSLYRWNIWLASTVSLKRTKILLLLLYPLFLKNFSSYSKSKLRRNIDSDKVYNNNKRKKNLKYFFDIIYSYKKIKFTFNN